MNDRPKISEHLSPVVEKRTTESGNIVYLLLENGSMWVNEREFHDDGELGFYCGIVSDPENLDVAIDVHEEEMRVLLAEAKEEFGA